MDTNVLVAIYNLLNEPDNHISQRYRSINRANSMGDALEYFVKDLFCGTLRESTLSVKEKAYSKYFSYLGNQNNPPDAIIRNGDAIEVKKFSGITANSIALNSSYPKDLIYSESSMISQACRDCEKWTKKDLLYIVGGVLDDRIRSMWLVYGDCYAADRKVYEKIKAAVSCGVNSLPNIDFGKTNEIARVNRVDPLGITDFRVRGMWGIAHPERVFDYVVDNVKGGFCLNAIMLKTKFNSFPKKDVELLKGMVSNSFTITDIKIKSPNNPANFLDAKLLRYIR